MKISSGSSGKRRREVETEMVNKILFSSKTDEWMTPLDLFEKLNREFRFDLDPATTPDNPLNVPYFYTKEEDGLKQRWFGRVFLNPPYSQVSEWVKKAYYECRVKKNCELVVLLIPSRTDTRWWHKYVMKANEIRFIKGRLKFGNAKNSAPFPSCLVIFKQNYEPLTIKSYEVESSG